MKPQSDHSLKQADEILRAEPSGVYGLMISRCRYMYLSELKVLSASCGLSTASVATRAIKMAKSSTRHVGYFIVGKGRIALEKALGVRVPLRKRAERFLVEHEAAVIFSAVFSFLTLLCFGLLVLERSGHITPASLYVWIPIVLLPGSYPIYRLVLRCWRLMRAPIRTFSLEWEGGVPKDRATLVAIPVLIWSKDQLKLLLERTKENVQRNSQGSICFALLCDFSDSTKKSDPTEVELISWLTEEVTLLNRELGNRLNLLHRERVWDPRNQVWWGWERKRGKVRQLNALIQDQKSPLQILVGTKETFTQVKYVCTLDEDARLPRQTVAALVATLAHPLYTPRVKHGKLIEGYTIAQPNVCFLPTREPLPVWRRVIPPDHHLSDSQILERRSGMVDRLCNRHLHSEYVDPAAFYGKGLYHVEAFEATASDHIPPQTCLSHDLVEGWHGKVLSAYHVNVFETPVISLLPDLNRWERWIRGDTQNFLFSNSPFGKPRIKSLSLLRRAELLMRVTSAAGAPSLLFLLLLGTQGVVPPWSFGIAFLVARSSLAMALGYNFVMSLKAIFDVRALKNRLRVLMATIAYMFLELAWLPGRALVSMKAFVLATTRVFTGRKRLEWNSASRQSQLKSDVGEEFLVIGPCLGWTGIIWCCSLSAVSSFVFIPVFLAWVSLPLIERLEREADWTKSIWTNFKWKRVA